MVISVYNHVFHKLVNLAPSLRMTEPLEDGHETIVCHQKFVCSSLISVMRYNKKEGRSERQNS